MLLFSIEFNMFLLEKRFFIVKIIYCFYMFVIYDLFYKVGIFFFGGCLLGFFYFFVYYKYDVDGFNF